MKQNVRVKLSRYTRLINALLYDNETIEFEIDHDEDVSELSEDDLMELLRERDLLFSADWQVVGDKAIGDENVFDVLSVSSDFDYDLLDDESLDDEDDPSERDAIEAQEEVLEIPSREPLSRDEKKTPRGCCTPYTILVKTARENMVRC